MVMPSPSPMRFARNIWKTNDSEQDTTITVTRCDARTDGGNDDTGEQPIWRVVCAAATRQMEWDDTVRPGVPLLPFHHGYLHLPVFDEDGIQAVGTCDTKNSQTHRPALPYRSGHPLVRYGSRRTCHRLCPPSYLGGTAAHCALLSGCFCLCPHGKPSASYQDNRGTARALRPYSYLRKRL